jgi:hypothetical protein
MRQSSKEGTMPRGTGEPLAAGLARGARRVRVLREVDKGREGGGWVAAVLIVTEGSHRMDSNTWRSCSFSAAVVGGDALVERVGDIGGVEEAPLRLSASLRETVDSTGGSTSPSIRCISESRADDCSRYMSHQLQPFLVSPHTWGVGLRLDRSTAMGDTVMSDPTKLSGMRSSSTLIDSRETRPRRSAGIAAKASTGGALRGVAIFGGGAAGS